MQALLDAETRTDRADRLVTTGALAAAAGVSIGLIRGILAGSIEHCHPMHHAVLGRLTLDDVARARSVPGSRGRRRLTGSNLVDPEATWTAIDRLRTHGWTIADLCEGLGYRRSSALPFTVDKVTARQARQVENLIAFLAGDETRPEPST